MLVLSSLFQLVTKLGLVALPPEAPLPCRAKPSFEEGRSASGAWNEPKGMHLGTDEKQLPVLNYPHPALSQRERGLLAKLFFVRSLLRAWLFRSDAPVSHLFFGSGRVVPAVNVGIFRKFARNRASSASGLDKLMTTRSVVTRVIL